MNRKIFLTLVTLLLSFSLIGCSNNTSSDKEKNPHKETRNSEKVANNQAQNKEAFFKKYLGDWYGSVARNEKGPDGSTLYYAAHIHIEKFEIGSDQNRTTISGTIYRGPTAVNENFNDGVSFTGNWDESKKVFLLENDNSFVLSNSDSNVASFMTYNSTMPTINDKQFEIKMKRMNVDDIQKEKDKYQKRFDTFMNVPQNDKSPQSFLGSWSGVIPSPNDRKNYMGIKFNFKTIEGNLLRGTYILVDNQGETPNYTMGVEDPFTATYDAASKSLSIELFGDTVSYMFKIDSGNTATFNSKYGVFQLSKQ